MNISTDSLVPLRLCRTDMIRYVMISQQINGAQQ